MIGPFGLHLKNTMSERALPMAHALVRRGHTVSMILPPWDCPADAGKTWLDDGVEIVNSPLPALPGPLFHLQLAVWLVQPALQRRPDVIHLFKPKAYAGLAHQLLVYLKRLGRHRARLVVDADDWEKAWNKLGNYTFWQRRFFAFQEPWGLRHAEAVTVASKYLQYLVESLRANPGNITYVPNGVRPIKSPVNAMKAYYNWESEMAAVGAGLDPMLQPSLDPAKFPLWKDLRVGEREFESRVRVQYHLFGYPLVLLYTRFFEFKLKFLLDVMLEINRRLPETRWLIVGRGFFGEEDRLAEMARRAGIAEKLLFAGWVPKQELPYYFAAANVAVYPYEDTPLNRTKCSVKLLDLLAAGVPVVAGNVGQNAEYIQHGKTGFLVVADSHRAMAHAALTILSEPGIQRRLGQEAARTVNRQFCWDELVKNVEAAYRAND